MRKVEYAVEWASGLLGALKAYYELLVALPDDKDSLPPYLGGRLPTQLYCPPDVLKRERPKETPLRSGAGRDHAATRSGPELGREHGVGGGPSEPRPAPEALDI